MAKDRFIIIKEFKHGWQVKEDPSRIPIGAAQKMINITLTDRGGIAPRKGESLVGVALPNNSGGTSGTSFKKSTGNPILMRSYEDVLSYYNNVAEQWSVLKSGYIPNLEFGYKEDFLNTDAVDYLYFCNGKDSYSRWCGYESKITATLVGGETTIPVESTLIDRVYWEGTATSVTGTTITVPANTWATDIWNGFYVRITSGANAGDISLISATTASQITFAAIAGLAGTPDFEIRRIAVSAPSGTLIYNGTEVAYTAIPTDSEFTVTSAAAAAAGDAITVIPQEYPENPRGNIFETSIAQMFVAGVGSALTTAFRSVIQDPTDFTFSSPRVAGEGDVILFPYNGSTITDIKSQENTLYVLKPDSVESVIYTQAGGTDFDLPQIHAIKQGPSAGSIARAWRQDDDIVFVTPDNTITSIGRIKLRDVRPQSEDLAFPIRRAVQRYNFDNTFGIQYINRAYVATKSTKDTVQNDILLVYNLDYRSWEGYWQIASSFLIDHNGKLYYGDSYTPNVYEMFTGINKDDGTNVFPMSCKWMSGFINGRGTGFYLNEVSSLAVEGYITSGTTINFKLYKDFNFEPFQELVISGLDTQFQDGVPTFSMLGGDPLGMQPLGVKANFGEPDEDGRRHFIAFIDFTITQIEYVAIEAGSTGLNQNWEIIALGLNLTENLFEAQNKISNQ